MRQTPYRPIHMRLKPEVRERLDILARLQRRSMTAVLEDLITDSYTKHIQEGEIQDARVPE